MGGDRKGILSQFFQAGKRWLALSLPARQVHKTLSALASDGRTNNRC